MSEMKYRRFGKTELQMPVLSCGGMRYQHKWQDVDVAEVPVDEQANLEVTIRRALELGINHIETARGYGSSEMQLGQILPTLDRDKMIVQTKVAPSKDPKEFLATFEKSMAYLKLDHVDLLGLHGVNCDEVLDWAIKPGGCFEVAKQLQKQGRVRHIGFSTHGPTDCIVKAIQYQDDDGQGFDYVNLHWYYIFQRNWVAIEEATKRDMGVFIISPSDKGGLLYDPPQKLVDLCKPLHPMTFNDLFCLSHPQVHTISVGAARPSDFHEHLMALPLLTEAKKHLTPIDGRLKEAMKQATGFDHPEQVAMTLPHCTEMPENLHAQVITWLRNLAVGWDMVKYGKMRYNLLGDASHWFPGCNAEKLELIDEDTLMKVIGDSPYASQVRTLVVEAHNLLHGEKQKRLSESG